jgi:hemerythrin-like metal-binding protein
VVQFIKWNEKFNTGNFVIDHQHRRLVQLINDLEEVIGQNEARPALTKVIFDEVSDYTRYHFQTEEELMESTHYSGIDDHKKLHKNFVEGLTLFKIEADKGAVDIDKALCEFLKDWLLAHIAIEDPKIIAEMTSGHGVV